jgi:hypothetical protein
VDANITKDPAYDAADPHDFPSMLDVNRYGSRSAAFDKIISATHDHFWDPLDKKFIDFDSPWDMENDYLVPAIREHRDADGGRGQADRKAED